MKATSEPAPISTSSIRRVPRMAENQDAGRMLPIGDEIRRAPCGLATSLVWRRCAGMSTGHPENVSEPKPFLQRRKGTFAGIEVLIHCRNGAPRRCTEILRKRHPHPSINARETGRPIELRGHG